MRSFRTIVVFHPAAIGDAMLASPVATTLKLNFPESRLIYWSHPILKPVLLDLCPAIDEFFDYERKANVFKLAGQLRALKPDLLVDLAGSSKSALFTLFSGAKVLRYEKQRPDARPIVHATTNFLQTISSVCPKNLEKVFPSIFPNAAADEVVQRILIEHGLESRTLVGVVPGVGNLRPHRAWTVEGWSEIIEKILSKENCIPVLIGGPEETALCQQLADSASIPLLNLAGKLKLPETAAALKRCTVVMSGDTGPSHIAVAVGTPVVGLYGPTYVERSGPFGCDALCLSRNDQCSCMSLKQCQFTGAEGAGQCMHKIQVADVFDKLQSAFAVIT